MEINLHIARLFGRPNNPFHFFNRRVWFWFRDVTPVSQLVAVRDYAIYVMLLTGLESLTWAVGIFLLHQDSRFRSLVFFIAIVLSFRLPRTFLPNDFHGENMKLFIFAFCDRIAIVFVYFLHRF